jgi:hypothetical protein
MVKLDDLLEKDVGKNGSDSLIEENLNLISKQSVEIKLDMVHHSLLIQQHENMFMKLIVPTFEDLFGLIAMQNQDTKRNTLDADLVFCCCENEINKSIKYFFRINFLK